MKLNDVRPGFEGSVGSPEQFFSIKDTGMIFDILRNKMYSNPILAIAREITSNARDAHREVGKPDEPIVIVLPNNLESSYRIKDFGPGISPDRMSNIFIQYTASTKRDDNVQTGGFGLGAKTPFSYSDTFTIITVHAGIKYQYAAYIDPTRVGKLRLMSEEATLESNGTEIIIPVEPKDYHFFAEWTEHACRHWTVKPIVRGGTIAWKTPNFILEGKGWGIAPSSNGDYNHQIKLVIDGIEYPLDLAALRTYGSTQLIDACKGNIILYYGIGELTLSASREQVYLDKPTQEKITLRLKNMQNDIKKLLDEKIDAFPNLWQANVYYRKELSNSFTNLNFLGKLAWKGIELHGSYIYIDCPTFSFGRGKFSRKHGTDPNKLSRSRIASLHFDEKSALFVNDLPIKEPTPRHVKKAFEDNPTLQSVQVICPNDVHTEEKLNKSIHLDKMAPRRLSEITKASGRAYTPASQRLLVFKFDPTCHGFRQVSYASIDEDTNGKVLCRVVKDDITSSRTPLIKDKQTISPAAMQSISDKNPQVSFYGVDHDLPTERVEEEFGDFQSLAEYVDEKILNNKTINYVEIKFAIEQNYHVDENVLRNLPKLQKLIQDPNSLFLKRAALHRKIKDINTGDNGLLQVYESIKGAISRKETDQFLKDHPEWDFFKVNNEYQKAYPLLEHINQYHYGNVIEPVAHYINLIDGWNKAQKTNYKGDKTC